jgi:hypothetical protein
MPMPGKELKDVRRIAREPEFGMDDETARDFGDYLEQCKRLGDRGTKNSKGDFTDDELREKAREFLGI